MNLTPFSSEKYTRPHFFPSKTVAWQAAGIEPEEQPFNSPPHGLVQSENPLEWPGYFGHLITEHWSRRCLRAKRQQFAAEFARRR